MPAFAYFMSNSDAKFYDSRQSFGWVSIGLHWLTAIIILVLWFLGDSIAAQEAYLVDQRRNLHMSIATSAYLILVFRIYWRFKFGHPHVSGQSLRIHKFARFVHYLLLVAVAVMLISGPVTAWSGGADLPVFGLVLVPWPFAESQTLHSAALAVHKFTGKTVMTLIVLHVAGALKHLMFHEDETIVRMLKPKRSDGKR